MANAWEDDPQANVEFDASSTYSLSDPQYDSAGALTGTTTRVIPIFTKKTTLKPAQQALFSQTQTLQSSINALAISQIGNADEKLGAPFSLSVLPAVANGPAAPTVQGYVPKTASLIKTIGADDLTADKQAIADALNDRLQFQIETDRSSRVIMLANQGILPGMQSYDDEMHQYDIGVNDARTNVILTAAKEQDRIIGLEERIGNFYNNAVTMETKQLIIVYDFANKAKVQNYQLLREVADYANQLRERALTETITERTQELNEITTLLHGGQVQIPKYRDFQGGKISDTPIGDYIYKSAELQEQNYQTKVSQQNALIGGISGIAGAIALAPMTGGGSLGGAAISGIGKAATSLFGNN